MALSAMPGLVIPGFIRETFTEGSRHHASTPKLLRSEVKVGGVVDFSWEAIGTAVYAVTAQGSVSIKSWDDRGNPIFDFDGFQVGCSCPDGDRQRLRSLSDGKLYVCKHAKAALMSVIDHDAQAKFPERRQKHVSDRAEALKAAQAAQEAELPGERDRIEHGLAKLGAEAVFKHLLRQTKTVAGLKSLATIFPQEVMPPKVEERCGRCKKVYDPQLPADRICRIEHPFDRVNTEWDGSKKSWDCCERCGRTFNLNGFHSWGKRRKNDPEDEGDYCFEGEHVPEKDYDPEQDVGMQFDDESDDAY